MNRPSDALIGQTAFGQGKSYAISNLANGGQFGYAPVVAELINNQAYMRGQLRCRLLTAPKFMAAMPDGQKWVDFLKAMVEVHATTIDGMKATVSADFEEHKVGGAGEVQHEVSDVKRAASEPTFTWIDKDGMPIQTLLYYWILYGMMDPDTKRPLFFTLSGVEKPTDWLMDWFTMSCLFYETDSTGRYVTKSWVTVNMMPRETGEIIGKFDPNSPRELSTLNIPFTGTSQFSLGGNAYAQQLLDEINLSNASPLLRASPITAIDANVSAGPAGYAESITDLSGNAVTGFGNA